MTVANKRTALFEARPGLFYLAPIPIVIHQVTDADRDSWHKRLMEDACEAFEPRVLDVPDVRHIHDLGDPPSSSEPYWSENQVPAVGVWHRVPTNGFLKLDTPAVRRLRLLIESQYVAAAKDVAGLVDATAHISESWIQFYQAGDYKVLHNHERYGPPYPQHRWAGSYYIDDGAPLETMPYAGVLSFRVRLDNHYFRPRAGLLLMWPADVLHEVHPFYGARHRVTVNFNVNATPVQWPEAKQ